MTVTVLAGPTAVGKGTVVTMLRQLYPQLWISVSATTRPPRPGEIDGLHYYFVSDAEFDQLEANDGLLESATVHNSYRYGTPRQAVSDAISAGKTVLLEVDLQGAQQIKQRLPKAHYIFLTPPSFEELRRRLLGRGTENPEAQERRLNTAKTELQAVDEFDDVVVNAELDAAVGEVARLLGLTNVYETHN